MAKQTTPRQYNDTDDIPALGLWNVRGKGAYPIGAMETATNVDILLDQNDKTRFEIRSGNTQSRSFTAASSAYSTDNGARCFVVDNGVLNEIQNDLSAVALSTGMGTEAYSYVEIGPQVLVLGASSQIISGTMAYPFFVPQPAAPTLTVVSGDLPPGQYAITVNLTDELGRQGPAAVVQTVDLTVTGGIQVESPEVAGYVTNMYMTTTNGEVLYECGRIVNSGICASSFLELAVPISQEVVGSSTIDTFHNGEWFDGRLWLATYVPEQDISYVFYSPPYWPHLFKPQSDYIPVHGKINSLDAVQDVLVITTQNDIFAYKDDQLQTLAEYGTVPGAPTAIDRATDKLYLWTTRGVCEALPLKNLTEDKVSLVPGSEASTAFLNVKGTKRFLVLTDTLGYSFNKY